MGGKNKTTGHFQSSFIKIQFVRKMFIWKIRHLLFYLFILPVVGEKRCCRSAEIVENERLYTIKRRLQWCLCEVEILSYN